MYVCVCKHKFYSQMSHVYFCKSDRLPVHGSFKSLWYPAAVLVCRYFTVTFVYLQIPLGEKLVFRLESGYLWENNCGSMLIGS